MRILIVEDDGHVQRALGRILQNRFVDPDLWVADTADLAIQYLLSGESEGQPFDLVISDYNLIFGDTGGDVLEWVRVHVSRLEDRFLFLSDDDRAQAMHRHFLRKPASSAEITAAINSLLDRS